MWDGKPTFVTLISDISPEEFNLMWKKCGKMSTVIVDNNFTDEDNVWVFIFIAKHEPGSSSNIFCDTWYSLEASENSLLSWRFDRVGF